LKVDLHLHSSEDPVDIIRHDALALIDRAVAQRFDALAITLHDRQLADPSLFDYARERGLVLIPGLERTIQGKHVLLINYPQSAESVRTLEEVAKLKARSNGLVIAPHPFYPDRSCLRSLMDTHADLFDAVEWSYFWTRATNFNTRAARWAQEHGKALVGNSDLHDLCQLGRTHSWVSADRNAEAICDAIRAGRVSLRTEPVPVLELSLCLGGMLVRGRKPVPVPGRLDTGRELDPAEG
jgi:predicted metal-dependent phosphoesterase TrpH